MPALQKKHKKSSVHNIKSVMNTRYGAGDRTRVHYRASVVEPPDGNSPPDCCIYMGSSPSPIPVKTPG